MERLNLLLNNQSFKRTNNGIVLLAGLYLRLSKEDKKYGYSVSIETQEEILRSFCEKNNIDIHDIYIDDGLSGGNYNRPGFIRMKEDIDSGVINCVLTKDLSRLGRDHIATDYLTEIYFPAMGVRYIAVDDNVDTVLRPDNEMIPFKNLFNDWYLRDTSRKVKNAKRQRMQLGLFVHGQTPYGYRKDPSDKNHLIIDDEAAEVVRLIFALAIKGNGVVRICRELENRHIIKPAVYKSCIGDSRFHRYNTDEQFECRWQPATVLKILKDITYLGKLDNHRTEVLNYKTKQRVSIPKEEHIVIENTHEPIISQEDFDLVQRLISSRYKPQTHEYDNIFKRVIYCGDCGGKMHIICKEKYDKEVLSYRCLKYYRYPEQCTRGNYIQLDVLKTIVEDELREIISYFRTDEKCLKLLESKMSSDSNVERLKDKIQKKKLRKKEIQQLIRTMYEDHVKGLLDMHNYKLLLSTYQDEQKSIEDDISETENELKKYENSEVNINLFREKLLEFADFKELTSTMVDQLIERIEVGHKRMVDGEEVRDIKIIYRFIGTF